MDLPAVHNYRSARQSADAAGLDARQAREEVVLAVTGTYLQLMAALALIDEQRVEVQYAEASYKQARAQADAGNKAPIDANRSLVELQTEQQRLRSQVGDAQKQKNALARLIGLPLRPGYQYRGKAGSRSRRYPARGRGCAPLLGAATGSQVSGGAIARGRRSPQGGWSRVFTFRYGQRLLRNAGYQS